jgi:hypothetical protein
MERNEVPFRAELLAFIFYQEIIKGYGASERIFDIA